MSRAGNAKSFWRPKVTTEGEEIECETCGKVAVASAVRIEPHSRRFVAVPPGWFADLGLCDSGQVACSLECAKRAEERS